MDEDGLFAMVAECARKAGEAKNRKRGKGGGGPTKARKEVGGKTRPPSAAHLQAQQLVLCGGPRTERFLATAPRRAASGGPHARCG